MTTQNKILNILSKYINGNILKIEIDYIRYDDWYVIYLCPVDDLIFYTHKIFVQEYGTSTVINFKDKRYDFIHNDSFDNKLSHLLSDIILSV